LFLRAGFSHDFPTLLRFGLAVGNFRSAVGKQFHHSERLGAMQVRVEYGDQSRPLLNDANPGMAVPVDMSFMTFGKSEESFEIEIVVGQVRLIVTDEQAREKTGHDLAHVLTNRISVRLELVP
jgi:hypothetical protein